MNTFKHILITLVGVLLFASCAEEDTFISDIENGENLASFTNGSKRAANIADGNEYTVDVRMMIDGPSVRDLSGDVTATVQPVFDGIDQANRAEAGTHFRMDSNQITLKESDGYIGKFSFTMLTNGLVAPLSKQLKLKITEVSGAENVINSGKTVTVNLSYACASNLQGTYDVRFVDASGNTVTYNGQAVTYSDTEVTSTGVGEYSTEIISVFKVGASRFRPSNDIGTGLTFVESCGDISVPAQTLGIYPNEVNGTEDTRVYPDKEDAQDGSHDSFRLKYSVENFGNWTAIYTKK